MESYRNGRNASEADAACAEAVGEACGLSDVVLYSGGAKGVDTISMEAALRVRGKAVAVVADSLVGAVRRYHAELRRGDLCLLTANQPDARFSVPEAMNRNKYIYCLADYAIVVASDAEKGGTWAGATEALKNKWVPVFVLQNEALPESNRRLVEKGAVPVSYPFDCKSQEFYHWLRKFYDRVKRKRRIQAKSTKTSSSNCSRDTDRENPNPSPQQFSLPLHLRMSPESTDVSMPDGS